MGIAIIVVMYFLYKYKVIQNGLDILLDLQEGLFDD